MKRPKSATTARAGVLFLEQAVNQHGSIFRPVHQEDDVGIDGFIEPVVDDEATGSLVAVQVKSGDSYLSKEGKEFVISVDAKHLKYWLEYMVPVVLVAHAPSKGIMSWVSVRDYVEHERYHNRTSIKSIRIPIHNQITKGGIGNLAELARLRSDERLLLRAADNCLSADTSERRVGFQILANHPDSRQLRLTCLMAKRMLMDHDSDIAKDALFILGYGVGRKRWSWNPQNQAEISQARFAQEICSQLGEAEIRRALELCDDELFHGPDALGERLFDVLTCCIERAEELLEKVMHDKRQPIQRRANAIYLSCECDDDVYDELRADLLKDPLMRDVALEMFGSGQ
ncbi:MAG TPA: DUF4365 domain-containing protein [Rhizomicrobium sp.]|nr:DUF4365 domain-containing protein [Rhizomicrobium sp.]